MSRVGTSGLVNRTRGIQLLLEGFAPRSCETRSFDQEHPDAAVGNCFIEMENCRMLTLDTDPHPKMRIQIPKPFICLAQKAFTRVLTPSPAKGGAGLVLLIVRTPEAC
jgi:hypothetical protein